MHVAVRANHHACAEMLMLAGCDLSLQNKAGQTAEQQLAAEVGAKAANQEEIQNQMSTGVDEESKINAEHHSRKNPKLNPIDIPQSLLLLRDRQVITKLHDEF